MGLGVGVRDVPDSPVPSPALPAAGTELPGQSCRACLGPESGAGQGTPQQHMVESDQLSDCHFSRG